MTALDKARAAVEALELPDAAMYAGPDHFANPGSDPTPFYTARQMREFACIALVRAMGDTPPVDRSGEAVAWSVTHVYPRMGTRYLDSVHLSKDVALDRAAERTRQCRGQDLFEVAPLIYGDTHPGPPAAVREALARMDEALDDAENTYVKTVMFLDVDDYKTLRHWLNENGGGR